MLFDTCRDDGIDRVLGLELGGDDYITRTVDVHVAQLALVGGLASRRGATAEAGRAPEGGAAFTVRVPA